MIARLTTTLEKNQSSVLHKVLVDKELEFIYDSELTDKTYPESLSPRSKPRHKDLESRHGDFPRKFGKLYIERFRVHLQWVNR